MPPGINLHTIANAAISVLHPNCKVTLYKSTGQKNVRGEIKATYAPGISLEAQIQPEGAQTLYHANMVGQEEVTRRVYLHSPAGASDRVAGIVRPVSRNGDFFQVDESDPWYPGQWFLILGPSEDYTKAGWECMRATMQTIPPEITVVG